MWPLSSSCWRSRRQTKQLQSLGSLGASSGCAWLQHQSCISSSCAPIQQVELTNDHSGCQINKHLPLWITGINWDALETRLATCPCRNTMGIFYVNIEVLGFLRNVDRDAFRRHQRFWHRTSHEDLHNLKPHIDIGTHVVNDKIIPLIVPRLPTFHARKLTEPHCGCRLTQHHVDGALRLVVASGTKTKIFRFVSTSGSRGRGDVRAVIASLSCSCYATINGIHFALET